MFRVLRTLGLALGVLAGIVGAQGPEFAQQYGQRLAGTVEELRRVVAGFEADAQATGHTRERAIARLRGDSDALVSRRGAAARADLDRLATLTARRAALDTAGGPLGRLVALIRDPDLHLARATYEDYRPAIPTTADGLVAGLLGFLAAWAGWRVLCDFGRRLIHRPSVSVTA
ncbi:hypothetical protein ASG60_14165 [Methylobacterium sp. Leaf469]|uniref:DUF2937 family protein n=1 Tax=Methylobacterium sp. Leaf469 TaxID=1736387 RepID=UPI0006FF0043|nr:DUF2937 family protein [Methylobacterium sp. Leaf469]KQT87106.1 hypothetical protein ASG60_14165 [Methylobacterium sp. Leaf469]